MVSAPNHKDASARFPTIQNVSAALLNITFSMTLKPAYVSAKKVINLRKLIEPQFVWVSVEIRLRQVRMKNAMMVILGMGMGVIRTVKFSPILRVHYRPQANAAYKLM